MAQGRTIGTATVKGRGPVCPVENWTVCSDDRLRFYYQDLRRIYNSFKKSLDPANSTSGHGEYYTEAEKWFFKMMSKGETGDAHKKKMPAPDAKNRARTAVPLPTSGGSSQIGPAIIYRPLMQEPSREERRGRPRLPWFARSGRTWGAAGVCRPADAKNRAARQGRRSSGQIGPGFFGGSSLLWREDQ